MRYIITLYRGAEPLYTYQTKNLAIAGKFYANPGCMVALPVYDQATRVVLKSTDECLERRINQPVRIICVSGKTYKIICDLNRSNWVNYSPDQCYNELVTWLPELNVTIARKTVRRLTEAMKANLSLWVTLTEEEAYPRLAEIKRLKMAQEVDNA